MSVDDLKRLAEWEAEERRQVGDLNMTVADSLLATDSEGDGDAE
jgi:hypothetical protein